MSGNLGDMVVTFSADISGLVDGVNQAQSQLADFATVTTDVSDQITQLVSTANVSDLTVQIDAATSSLTTMSTEVADTASSLQQMGPAANLSGFVSDIDVAQAQLVLLQSKVADATAALQEMYAAANESGDYSGIADAQAQLVLLQAKAQDAAASLQELQTAESDTSGSTGFGDAISGMMSNLGNFGSSIGEGISSLLGMGSQLGMTVMGFQMLGQQAQQAASALLTPAATAETTTLSFTTLLHSTQAAHDEMVALNTYAATTPMQTQWIDNAAAKILAFGGTTQQVIPEINSIGDALSGLGKLSESSLNSIVDIFGKISAQGKITGGDMMQLSTWGIPAWNALSEAMGKPIPVLQQMVSKGLVPASTAIPALEKGMENVFGGGMAKQAQTFTGIISTLASDWQIAMASIGGPLLKIAETGLAKLSEILASPAFQQFATQIGVQIANTLLNIGTFISKNVIPPLIQFGTYLGSMAPTASSLFTSMWTGLQQVGNFLVQTFTPVWQQLVNTFNTQLVPAWQNFYASILPVMPELETAAQWIGVVLVGAIVILVQQLAELTKGSVIVFGGLVQIVGGAMTIAAGYIAQFVDVMTGNWNQLTQDQVTIGNGWQQVWAGVWNGIVGIFGGAINGLIDMVNGWISQTVGAFNAVSGAVGGPTISVGSIGHVGTISVPKPQTVQGTQIPTGQQTANPMTAPTANPFTQFLNSLNQLTSSSSATSENTKALTTSIPSAVSSAAASTSSAVSGASTKSAEAQQKAADSANAQRLKLAADQQKALQDSSSSAVKALVAQSQAAAAKGDTSTAAFYASQADTLAAQQKAAATKAANQKAAAAKKAAAAAKKKKTTSTTSKTGTASTSKSTSTSSSSSSKTTGTGASSSSGGTTLTTTTTTPSGTTVTATTTTPTGATGTGTPQTLTLILEIDGKQFGAVVAPFVMNAAAQRVRLKTGLKV